MSTKGCVFCRIVAGKAPAKVVCRWEDALAFVPLDPVTDGHTLVVPTKHVRNYTSDPDVTAATMRRAALLAPQIDRESNLITSCGPLATQTVFHLHVHIVPRRRDDGLALPWTPIGGDDA
jgi:histidine triad (HIT) family protein